jgi:uncharacterized protein YecE (DUF72 family)
LPEFDLVRTANWGYVRLRDDGYTDRRLRNWIMRIKAQNWKQVYVFFKHESTGTGPKLATRLMKLAAT